MTPQERDLITNLLGRLKAQAGQPKDSEAEALIRQGMAEQPDAPYLLVQTVLIQDMALNSAQGRIAELERQLAQGKPEPQQPASFLGGAGRGSVPTAGPWSRAAQPEPAPAAPRGAWTQSGGAAPAAPPMAAAPMMGQPAMMPGAGSGFLRQAATTAAGIAGGALLFQGIQSLFGPHYGGGFMSGMPMQPGISETVVNNYYDQPAGPDLRQADLDDRSAGMAPDPGQDYADNSDTSDADFASDQDFGAQDFGDDNYDV